MSITTEAVARSAVNAELDQNLYPNGIKIPDQQMDALTRDGILTRHQLHGEWNYDLNPVKAATNDTPEPH